MDPPDVNYFGRRCRDRRTVRHHHRPDDLNGRPTRVTAAPGLVVSLERRSPTLLVSPQCHVVRSSHGSGRRDVVDVGVLLVVAFVREVGVSSPVVGMAWLARRAKSDFTNWARDQGEEAAETVADTGCHVIGVASEPGPSGSPGQTSPLPWSGSATVFHVKQAGSVEFRSVPHDPGSEAPRRCGCNFRS